MSKYTYAQSSKITQYPFYWDKTQVLKKFPLDKINVTKMHTFFLSWAPTHHILQFDSRLLNEQKHKVHLFKNVRFYFFQFRFLLLNSSILFNQKHELFYFKMW